MLARDLTIRFDSNVTPGLPWKFEPEQNAIKLHIGEVATVHYKVINEAARTITAQASYNVSPPTVGAYFDKINCFCFTQQTMKPGETREMTVVFYVDPAIVKDRDQDTLNTITLSYTFYRLPEQERPVAETPDNKPIEQALRKLERRRWPTLTPNITTTTWSIRARGRPSARPAPLCWRSAASAGCIICTPRRRWCSASASSACSTPSSAGGAT